MEIFDGNLFYKIYFRIKKDSYWFDEIDERIGLTSDPYFKGVVVVTDEILSHLNRRSFLRPSTLRLLKGEEKEVMGRFMFQKHDALMFEPINDAIEKLHASGIIKHQVSQYLGLKIISDDEEPKVLTMDHLGICFIICSMVAALSFVAFLIELSVKALQQIGKALKRLVVANGIIKTLFRFENGRGFVSH